MTKNENENGKEQGPFFNHGIHWHWWLLILFIFTLFVVIFMYLQYRVQLFPKFGMIKAEHDKIIVVGKQCFTPTIARMCNFKGQQNHYYVVGQCRDGSVEVDSFMKKTVLAAVECKN